jgi:hypothetical protein
MSADSWAWKGRFRGQVSWFKSFSSGNCKEFAKLPKQRAPWILKFENLAHIDLHFSGTEARLNLTQKAHYCADRISAL